MSAIIINSVIGSWTSATPAAGVSGINTNEIKWGTPAGSSGQSGYKFVGVAPPPVGVTPNTAFDLGTFTHNNFPITGNVITAATLKVDFQINVDGQPVSLSSFFDFAHDETPNTSNHCAYGGANGQRVNINGCADSVKFVTNAGQTQSFTYQGFDYVVNISGFLVNNVLASQFLTIEGRANNATLRGEIIKKEDLNVVPIPAAAWLLLSGLGGLGFLGRRRKA
jgi:hypothetical protein